MCAKAGWIRNRHRILKRLFSPFFTRIAEKTYGCRIDRFVPDGRNYLVLVNHQTDVDQYIVNAVFPFPVYFVVMEDLLSRGAFSRFLEWAAAPVPILKGTVDVRAVRTCMKVAGEGGTIVLFPEGNRTYSGKTCYIGPQIARFIKLLKLPVIILRLEGGYGIKPRWSDHIRKGNMRAHLAGMIEPETYSAMSNEELYAAVKDGLYTDDTVSGSVYTSEKAAEGLERVFYFCPDCGLTQYRTEGRILECKRCGRILTLGDNQKLKAPDGSMCSLSEFYDGQENYIRELDLTSFEFTPAYTDRIALYKVILYKRKKMISRGINMSLFSDRIKFDGGNGCWHFDGIRAMTCVADHKLNVCMKDAVYQITGDTHFNALKYCNFYYHYIYVKEGHKNGEFQFLGL